MSTSGADNGLHGGTAGILTDPSQSADGGFGHGVDPTNPVKTKRAKKGGKNPKPDEDDPKEAAIVKKWWDKYEKARKFDENFRKQIAIDRRYAAGTSDLAWAVTTNLIGAFIDILNAILYARDPEVSVRKAEQVDAEGTMPMDVFAKTLEIVIAHLWRRGKLKKAMKKAVRSVLSNSEGWLKCLMIAEKDPNGEVETKLNDVRETLALLQAQKDLLEDPQGKSDDEIQAELDEKNALLEALEDKLELTINKMFVIDFVPTENIQVSADVACVGEYLDANWIGNEWFLSKDECLAAFPELTPDDLTKAKNYFQRPPKELTTREIDNVLPQGTMTAEASSAYTSMQSDAEGQSPTFYRCVEIWDRQDKKVRTMVDGVNKWAKEPFDPPYPSSRFYPYFYFAFYEVDGQRHPQSLSWRLYKLQDEYSASRSNFRLTRERSIPGVLFNAAALDSTEAKKLTESKHQEYTGLNAGDPNVPLENLFTPKPVQSVDMRVFDPTLILNDMERMSGVQEALSSVTQGPGNPKTATEANIEQSGTAARTSAARDAEEDMLTELAQYTAEQAIQALTRRDAMRMAGAKAFWPAGMDLEDLFTLVEVQITAGSTGKPKDPGDQQNWAQLFPMIKETLGEIRQALANGDTATATSLTELVKETMHRMGDESDPDRFIPKQPPPGSKGAGTPPPPVTPNVTVAIKGVIDPATAAALVSPAVAQDAPAMAAAQRAMAASGMPTGTGVPSGPPGAAPAPGPAMPPAPAAPAPGGPGP